MEEDDYKKGFREGYEETYWEGFGEGVSEAADDARDKALSCLEALASNVKKTPKVIAAGAHKLLA